MSPRFRFSFQYLVFQTRILLLFIIFIYRYYYSYYIYILLSYLRTPLHYPVTCHLEVDPLHFLLLPHMSALSWLCFLYTDALDCIFSCIFSKNSAILYDLYPSRVLLFENFQFWRNFQGWKYFLWKNL